jgi:hypothetical protein
MIHLAHPWLLGGTAVASLAGAIFLHEEAKKKKGAGAPQLPPPEPASAQPKSPSIPAVPVVTPPPTAPGPGPSSVLPNPNLKNLVPTGTVENTVQTSGIAKTAATALYGYLKQNGCDGSVTLKTMTIAFQTASNVDPNAIKLSGPLPNDGTYDAKTSAALTMYTQDPIPACTPPAPTPPMSAAQAADMSQPGDAATAASNLYTYLKQHGCDGSDALKQLVTTFQTAQNTDAKGTGPVSALMPLTAALSVDGRYESLTGKALGTYTGGDVPPACHYS